MTTYKISGTTSHDADVHVIQNDTYFGKKAVSAGAYEVTIDSAVASDITTIAKKSDGNTVSYGDVEAVTSSGIADLTAITAGMGISSIQQGTITLGASDTQKTATIDSVSESMSIIIHNGVSASTINDAKYTKILLTMPNSTTIQANRYNSGGIVIVGFMVIEFSSGISSIQRGTINLTGGNYSVTDTIFAVNTDKAFVMHTGTSTNDGSSTVCETRVSLENSTTVRAQSYNSTNNTYVGYQVIEFS